MFDDDSRLIPTLECLARLIAANNNSASTLNRLLFLSEQENPKGATGVGRSLNGARARIVSFQPRNRQEAMIKLSYLVAVAVATRMPMSNTELVELSASIARFKVDSPHIR
jgi:hypothetical protein